jgi:hypothetical protein
MAYLRPVGLSEIAELLGVSIPRKDFPDEVELVAPIDEMTEAAVRAMLGQSQDGNVTAVHIGQHSALSAERAPPL